MEKFYVCVKEAPWSQEKGERAIHPDAISVGECSESCCNDYECPNCGHKFRVQGPDY